MGKILCLPVAAGKRERPREGASRVMSCVLVGSSGAGRRHEWAKTLRFPDGSGEAGSGGGGGRTPHSSTLSSLLLCTAYTLMITTAMSTAAIPGPSHAHTPEPDRASRRLTGNASAVGSADGSGDASLSASAGAIMVTAAAAVAGGGEGAARRGGKGRREEEAGGRCKSTRTGGPRIKGERGRSGTGAQGARGTCPRAAAVCFRLDAMPIFIPGQQQCEKKNNYFSRDPNSTEYSVRNVLIFALFLDMISTSHRPDEALHCCTFPSRITKVW